MHAAKTIGSEKHGETEGRTGTKQRLLEAAARIFADVGFRETTVQDICSAAEANLAAVNYHFGSKEKLYLEVWATSAQAMQKGYLEPVASIEDPEARLKEIIRYRVKHTFTDGPEEHLRKLAFNEMGAPTESHNTIVKQFLRPSRDLLTRTVAQILNVANDNAVAKRCAFSLHSQLIFLNVLSIRGRLHHTEFLGSSEQAPTNAETEELIRHIETFVLGGIRETARQSGHI